MGDSPASRAAVLEQAQQLAEERAVVAGARPGSCWVASREDVPLAYLPGRASRVRVKVIGELDVARFRGCGDGGSSGDGSSSGARKIGDQQAGERAQPAEQAATAARGSWGSAPTALEGWPPLPGRGEEPSPTVLAAWQPVLGPAGDWLLHEQDLYLLALGAGTLGCGGGGSPSKALLKAVMELQR